MKFKKSLKYPNGTVIRVGDKGTYTDRDKNGFFRKRVTGEIVKLIETQNFGFAVIFETSTVTNRLINLG